MLTPIKSEQKVIIEIQNPVRQEFLNRPLGVLFIKNAIPAVLSLLFMSAYQVVDALMLAQRMGANALAAVNIIYPVVALLVGLAVMLGVGGNARIAVLAGGGHIYKAGQILGLVICLGSGLGLAGSLIIGLNLHVMVKFLGADDVLTGLSTEYLGALMPFAVPMILFFILEQSMRNDGKSLLATLTIALSILLNIALNYIFLFLLNVGMIGAALATGISQSLGMVVFLGYFLANSVRKKTGLLICYPAFDMKILRDICFNGFSEFFNSIAAGVSTFLFNLLLMEYAGAAGVVAFSVMMYIILIGANLFIGIAGGIQPMLSYNYGAGNLRRVKRTLKLSLVVSCIAGAVLFFFQWFFLDGLVGMFIPDDGTTQSLAVDAGRIISWVLLLMPVGILGSSFLTALEMAKHSLLLSVMRSMVLVLIGLFLLPRLMGLDGLWATPVFAEIGTVIIAGWMILRWRSQTFGLKI
jgi:Na+-driven multidrug efflux pump